MSRPCSRGGAPSLAFSVNPKGDQRFNHWTAVRNGLMSAHADLFAQIPAIVKMLPEQIDQMFKLIETVLKE